ncbi:membrane-associated protein [Beutenbergia cavernae DSM 12333]|uniref:Membrane-associated protein n=1 Tax=Beutenbergia cavernae (strain ATCC BAA-8 / DSM 12333 / CCUG 43141 / JCM 11478 / NBRC 16432 / NCIMB 13614 / HKI 0122) TaxID=471853 RepID=C5C4P9_BEUC1|nr:VTT domain-containing protein [Beutenbergia cavernae]ACQ80027.1 membrane-associated protein [Beutenbergia cavernae DSM 12333]
MTVAGSLLEPTDDVAAAYGLDGFPFGWVVVALFGIVLLRAQATYWLGRAVAAGVWHTRLASRLDSPGMTRALGFVHRWGPLAVTLSFFTVGFQTMVNAAAGLVRMPWPRYTIAMVPGCIAWAFIYATVGLGAFLAIAAAATGSGWGIAASAVLLAAVVAAVVVTRRRRRAAARDEVPVETAPRG